MRENERLQTDVLRAASQKKQCALISTVRPQTPARHQMMFGASPWSFGGLLVRDGLAWLASQKIVRRCSVLSTEAHAHSNVMKRYLSASASGTNASKKKKRSDSVSGSVSLIARESALNICTTVYRPSVVALRECCSRRFKQAGRTRNTAHTAAAYLQAVTVLTSAHLSF